MDHVATLRQARGGRAPDPVAAALEAEAGGADGIVFHLREDRRHIQDADVRALKRAVRTKLDFEMAATPEMIRICRRVRPDLATLVPEKRAELTTEGGLDVAAAPARIARAVQALRGRGITVSLFIDPAAGQVRAAAAAGAKVVELHTGEYANACAAGRSARRAASLRRLREATRLARSLGLRVLAGHGLDYANVAPVAGIPGIEEFNIGHAIVARAVFVGMRRAVRQMRAAIRRGAR